MTDNKKAEAKGKETNLWQEILREAMTKKDLEDANIFIFGDQFTGKKSLLRVMNNLIQKELDDNKDRLEDIIIQDKDSNERVECYFGNVDYNLELSEGTKREYLCFCYRVDSIKISTIQFKIHLLKSVDDGKEV